MDAEKGLGAVYLPRSVRGHDSSCSIFTVSAGVSVSQTKVVPKPSTRLVRVVRHIRFTVFTVYQRLFTLVFICNLIAAVVLYQQRGQLFHLNTLAALASSNFLVAILIRQDVVVNLIFRTAWLVPWSLPLSVRRMVTRVYCYGGIHSGAAVAGTLWWVIFTVMMSWQAVDRGIYTPALLVLTLSLSTLLIIIIALALPAMRDRFHDSFELSHRFLGWSSIALFWVQLFLLIQYTSTTSVPGIPVSTLILHSPTAWNLLFMTALLIYPWLRLRRWTFTARVLSSHALLLTFPQKVHKFSCLTISDSPLKEWHPFATFPSTTPSLSSTPDSNPTTTTTTTTTTPPPQTSLVISSAGDWTRSIITSTTLALAATSQPSIPLRLYVKSHPVAGVLSLSCIFRRVVILTTGSGIGPSLSSLLDRPPTQFARLIWSARAPLATYGADMLALVARADADALVLDTSADAQGAGGRPDLLAVAARVYAEVGAEAVFVLSNRAVTGRVVRGLVAEGIPAFGPIWDS
jgi:hypothetical protein